MEASGGTELKAAVRAHWEDVPCGTRDVSAEDRRKFFAQIEHDRYTWEPYIPPFAQFATGRGKRVLEVGVGAGTDFVNWVRHGAIATGVDLTEHGISLTRERLALEGLQAELRVADAEALPFDVASFDLVYSYGVLHHSPDTQRAVDEVWRVLRPGGQARVMIYHYPSWVCLALWGVHAAAKGRPWESPREVVYKHLESPGTKVFTVAEGRELFRRFSKVDVRPQLSHGDLLLMPPSHEYRGRLHRLAWRLYPRPLVRALGNHLGTGLLIEAVK